ncbi:OmpL47-type beta-barrel domain-containing protein [Candidatus Pristimantibacillus sp. PTI5]|uniref:OmpL47-type beta-barrel domain-containing protein n=1 Tax=Candidatus Pristimantibacillus sp. PTI5 TaxID=3400422 RepID=UPI003B0137AB
MDGTANTYVHDGSYIALDDGIIEEKLDAVTGTVADFTKALAAQNEIIIEAATQPAEIIDLVGKSIMIQIDGVRKGTFRIKGVTALDGNRIKLDIGDISLVRSYKDPYDFSQGFNYDIAAGAQYRIPLTYTSSEDAQPESPAFNANISAPTNSDVAVTITYPPSAAVKENKKGEGGDWTVYTEPITFAENGILYTRSKDFAGNLSPAASYEVRNIDKVPPVTTAILDPAQPVILSLHAADTGSGVQKTEYSLDNGTTWQLYRSDVTVDMQGNYALLFKSSDAAGNAESA